MLVKYFHLRPQTRDIRVCRKVVDVSPPNFLRFLFKKIIRIKEKKKYPTETQSSRESTKPSQSQSLGKKTNPSIRLPSTPHCQDQQAREREQGRWAWTCRHLRRRSRSLCCPKVPDKPWFKVTPPSSQKKTEKTRGTGSWWTAYHGPDPISWSTDHFLCVGLF